LYEDGKEIFDLLDGSAGYNGVMIESPYYMGVEFNNLTEENIIKSAYAFEELMIEALKLELGTCWISLVNLERDLKKKIVSEDMNEILYIASLGYEKEKGIINNTYSSRLSIKDIVYKDNWENNIDLDELEKRGLDEIFYNIINAPSNRNSQPWRFIVKDDKVLICLEEISNLNLIDVGIIIFYFEGMAHDVGYNINWQLLDINNKSKGYVEIAEFNI